MMAAFGEADAFQQLLRMRDVSGTGGAVGEQRDQHVFQHRALRQQVVILEDEADVGGFGTRQDPVRSIGTEIRR